ncbi:hypothetical protein UA08_00498 [Talaromyces atroroseus]|uniref:Inositol polyphosphate-related phosphatase domain-containing protein n=1 Tax=Talaromyces atroroseus TaxID=1441469 RepID=A0A225AZT6_TALAT|nr:hypothetical protein UA08_00498 [Talaromyces atroroseus]OKL63964.1 hypothetical protein UA08_00498 [Talaromyces atroroseus]
MAEDNKEVEGTDEASLRPVSSLLSHFEHLSYSKDTPAGSGTNGEHAYQQRLNEPETTKPLVRASLDLPRPLSPWAVADRSQNGTASASDLKIPRRSDTSRERSPASRGHFRLKSMNVKPTPAITPTLTVDSPRSPPRGTDGLSNGHFHSLSRGDLDLREIARPRQRSPPGALGARSSRSPTASPVGTPQISRSRSPNGTKKSTSVPPPVARAEKPKIPAKPANISHLDVHHLAPTPSPKPSPVIHDHVSPFSTPPGSPEKTLPKGDIQQRKPPNILQSSSTTPEPLTLLTSVDINLRPSIITSNSTDARELGFTRRTATASPTGHSRSPSQAVSTIRDLKKSDQADSNKSAESSHTEIRPALPPRDGLPGRQSRSIGANDSKNPDLPPRPSVDLASRSTRISSSHRLSMLETNTHFAPPPRRQASIVSGKSGSRTPQTPKIRQVSSHSTDNAMLNQSSRNDANDSEDEGYPEQTPVSRTDYPDSSQVNRRPPVIKTGPLSIPTRYDTREFDVCGKHVCTTGYLTRAWDLTTGEQKLSISHGETVKAHSVAFKPGTGLGDEGTRLWVGTSIGELHEIDIETQSIVTSRLYPSRREVIKIYRHKKEMWTLDDEGNLLVWPPDETGVPNLQYSYDHPQDRVAKGHTFSMVVGDDLWLATGKEVRVYRPNAQGDAFHVLRKPLGANHSGEVTAGAHTTKNGGRVYLGHADGKVTVYSSIDFSCLASVNVSVYKINSLAMVGDYLWAAYKTGMVYVYDVSTNPWIVKKDWHAHGSPVCGLVLDPSSLWVMNRLQVVSLGTDNFLRLWDGMLEDDWLETRMQSKDVEYCNFREIRAAIVTWNAGASVPRDLHHSGFIQDAIHPEQPPEILVFGFQELVDLEDKKITAKSLLMGSKKKDNNEKEHMSRQYRVWRDHLAACINDAMPLEESYVLLHSANLVGLFTCVFIKQRERERVRNISGAEVKRGMGGLHGNKGALIFRFVLDDSSLCFINCHLAAGQTHTAHRNNDIAAILETESLPAEHSIDTRTDLFVNGGDGTMILDHEICILNGDLNYRIDSMSRNVVIDAVRQNNLPKLLERDQLLASKRKNPSFRLRTFNEAPITFPPTYKYDVNSDEYDTSDKKRSPAWCDRVLYRGVGKIKQTEYRRHEVRASDHRPVSASFKMRIKSILPKERAAAWETCQKEFSKEKKRLACDSSVEYLVNVFGMSREQARKVIVSGGSSK